MKRLEELDGLRGIAAFMVFLSHAIGLMASSRIVDFYQNSPIRVISDGAAAVDVFFVLSGFVLSLPFIDQNKDLNYFSFVAKRIFRLYPAYWISVFLTIAIKQQFDPGVMHFLSEWAKTLWIKPVTNIEIIRHLPLIAKMDASVINPIIWTLAVEMKMSLILPIFIFWLKRWGNTMSQVALLATSVMLSYLSGKFMFLPLFVLGLILSKNWRRFIALKNTHLINLFLLFALSIILLGNRFIIDFGFTAHSQSLIASIGAGLFILLAIWCREINAALKHPVIDFIGKISYSFYLYHFPLLLVVVSILHPVFNSVVMPAAISLFMTIIISYVSYKQVEYKGMMMYRNLARLAPQFRQT